MISWTKQTQFPAIDGSCLTVTINESGVFLSVSDEDGKEECCVEVTKVMASWLTDVMMSDSVENKFK